ncbi:uncharacterized protein LOC132301639 [Cornus florida]|uniref:uncharacterized protein LOC132301639 n=1 Tax=Cornus florida TaxID=4283 RepID=UPI0028990B51|nr:uncharacterized protein LOC132301639 [Cornus florida]
MEALTKRVEQLMTSQLNFTPHSTNAQGFEVCCFCSSPSHHVSICPNVAQYSEIPQKQVNATYGRPGVANPRGVHIIDDITGQEVHHEQVQGTTALRSGKRVENKVEEEEAKNDENWKKRVEEKKERNKEAQETPPTTRPSPESMHAIVPFPRKLQATSKMGEQQIPAYAKFLKDICTQKRRLNSQTPKKVLLTEQTSSIIQHCNAPKFKDPGAPTILCTIGNHQVDRALLDLGASINLLPYSVYLQLRLGELKSTSIIIQLADRSTKQPHGIIEEVIIKVDKFYFPMDFIVLDTKPVPEPRRHIPVIFGRSFLAKANASINYRTGIMDLSFGNMKVRLNIFNAIQFPSDNSDCFLVYAIDECVEEVAPFALT